MSKGYYTKRINVRGHTRFDPRIKKRVSVDSYPRNQRYRDYKTISREEAIRRFNQKSKRARNIDISKTSKTVLDKPNEYWLENMGRSDVKNIDVKELEGEKELLKLKDSFRGEFNEDLKDSPFGKGVMSKDNVSGIVDNESFKRTEWFDFYKNIKSIDINNQAIMTSLTDTQIKYLKIGDYTYRLEDVEDSLKNLKNPKITYKEGFPLLIKGDNYSMIISPFIGTSEEWENYKEISYKDYKKHDWREDWKKTKKVSPTDTKEIVFNGKKLTVLASTWEENFNPITEKNKKEMEKWIKEHPEAKTTDHNFRNYHPYIQNKIINNLKEKHDNLNEILRKESILGIQITSLEKEMGKTSNKTKKFADLKQKYQKLKGQQSSLIKERDKAIEEKDQLLAKPKPKPKTQKEKTPKKPDKLFLPKLTGDNKYILAYVNKDGYARYIGYTKNPEKAIKDLNAERKISKKLGVKSKIELFVAADIHDVRKQIHTRGRESYLITGDTYPNRKKIHQIARVKFDYTEKGYRGKFSKEELEEIKKIPGIEIKKFRDISKEDIKISNIEKAHSKTRKYLRHERKAGSTWQKDNPFTKEQQWTWNSLTHYPQDWNKEFKNSVDKKESEILRKLKINKIENAPEDVQNAFDYYRKNVYEWVQEYNRARQVAPPISVVGPAKYPTHKIPKADAIRKRASEKLEKSKKTVDKITYQYVDLQPRKTAEEVRQEYREKITPKLIKAKEKRKKVYSLVHSEWYPIERVNKKTITVKAKTGDYNFTIDKSFIKQIEN